MASIPDETGCPELRCSRLVGLRSQTEIFIAYCATIVGLRIVILDIKRKVQIEIYT